MPDEVTYTFRRVPHALLYVCDLCSATTDDPSAHADWHEGNPVPTRGSHSVTVPKGRG